MSYNTWKILQRNICDPVKALSIIDIKIIQYLLQMVRGFMQVGALYRWRPSRQCTGSFLLGMRNIFIGICHQLQYAYRGSLVSYNNISCKEPLPTIYAILYIISESHFFCHLIFLCNSPKDIKSCSQKRAKGFRLDTMCFLCSKSMNLLNILEIK